MAKVGTLSSGGRMPLNIDARWHSPVELTDGTADGLIYSCPSIDTIPKEPGVYVFGRFHGEKVTPFYVGRTKNLRTRIEQHLKAVPLMRRIETASTGQRFLLYCTISLKRGQKIKRVLEVLEGALIAYSLGRGFELFQKQGTRRPAHAIRFSGNRTSEALAPRSMRLRAS
jgi:hypothetical protein